MGETLAELPFIGDQVVCLSHNQAARSQRVRQRIVAPPTVRLMTRVVERIGIMVAWIFAIHQIGSATAAYLSGLLRIAFGTYFDAFVVAGLLLFVAAAMVLCIGAGKSGHEPEIAPAARAHA
jgi:hypothetical protein